MLDTLVQQLTEVKIRPLTLSQLLDRLPGITRHCF
jgi:hypothetical protein